MTFGWLLLTFDDFWWLLLKCISKYVCNRSSRGDDYMMIKQNEINWQNFLMIFWLKRDEIKLVTLIWPIYSYPDWMLYLETNKFLNDALKATCLDSLFIEQCSNAMKNYIWKSRVLELIFRCSDWTSKWSNRERWLDKMLWFKDVCMHKY